MLAQFFFYCHREIDFRFGRLTVDEGMMMMMIYLEKSREAIHLDEEIS